MINLINIAIYKGQNKLNVVFKYLKDFKSSNIQDANEGSPLSLSPIQSFVDTVNKPAKKPFICSFCQGFYCKVCLKNINK